MNQKKKRKLKKTREISEGKESEKVSVKHNRLLEKCEDFSLTKTFFFKHKISYWRNLKVKQDLTKDVMLTTENIRTSPEQS